MYRNFYALRIYNLLQKGSTLTKCCNRVSHHILLCVQPAATHEAPSICEHSSHNKSSEDRRDHTNAAAMPVSKILQDVPKTADQYQIDAMR